MSESAQVQVPREVTASLDTILDRHGIPVERLSARRFRCGRGRNACRLYVGFGGRRGMAPVALSCGSKRTSKQFAWDVLTAMEKEGATGSLLEQLHACDQCGFNLRYSTESRCPECGADELHAADRSWVPRLGAEKLIIPALFIAACVYLGPLVPGRVAWIDNLVFGVTMLSFLFTPVFVIIGIVDLLRGQQALPAALVVFISIAAFFGALLVVGAF